jgi:hypothetical protein
MSARYTADGKRRSSMAHARHQWTCPCGRVCRGNGGKSSHQRACLVWAAEALRIAENMLAYAREHNLGYSIEAKWETERAALLARLTQTPAAEDDTRSRPARAEDDGEDNPRHCPGLPGAGSARGAQPPPPQVVPSAGDPCPRGCTTDPRREVPELLVMNVDREVSCPTCWECFGIAP